MPKLKPTTEKIAALGLVEPPPIEIESPAFRGSLATLFQCVREQKVDLLGVPLAPICMAYLQYVIDNPDVDVDAAAAACMALSFLVERKSWLLLPSSEPEPQEDESFELPEPTAHEYALVIETLRQFQAERERFFFRKSEAGPDPYEVPFELEEVSPADLARALERLLQNAVPETPEMLQRPRRSLGEQMAILLGRLTGEFRPLEAIVPSPYTRQDAVYSFLAILELIRLGQARAQVSGDEVLFARNDA